MNLAVCDHDSSSAAQLSPLANDQALDECCLVFKRQGDILMGSALVVHDSHLICSQLNDELLQ